MEATRKVNLWRRISQATGLLLVALMFSLALAACGSDNVRSLTGSTTTTSAATAAGTTSAATATNTTTAATGTSNNVQKVSQPNAPTQATAGTSSDQTESNSVVSVVNKANPAVVTVYNQVKYSSIAGGRFGGNGNGGRGNGNGGNGTNGTTPTNPNAFVTQGIGSGVIISPDGYIVTNNHVVDGQENLTVALNDGKTPVPAKLIGQDKLGDIAVIKIDAKVTSYLKWADSAQVGETVVAIGSALGDFRNSVSKGVVSGLNRTLPVANDNNVYLQTDAAINHGNSGGPLLNLNGDIVGINTAVLRSTGSGTTTGSSDVAEGLGFAIPSQYAKLLSDEIINQGKVTRPFFGISYNMITPADAGTLSAGGQTTPAVEGAWIHASGNQSGVVKDGPADKAGLKDGDVITGVDGQNLDDSNPLQAQILKHKPGDTIKLTVQRGTQSLSLSLTLAERPAGQ